MNRFKWELWNLLWPKLDGQLESKRLGLLLFSHGYGKLMRQHYTELYGQLEEELHDQNY